MKKIQKLDVKRSDKYFVVYVYSDPNVAVGSMLVGPKYVVITTANNLTEADSYIDNFFKIEPTCMRCRSKYRGDNYFRIEIKPDSIDAVCGECDPTVKFAVKYFELIDVILP